MATTSKCNSWNNNFVKTSLTSVSTNIPDWKLNPNVQVKVILKKLQIPTHIPYQNNGFDRKTSESTSTVGVADASTSRTAKRKRASRSSKSSSPLPLPETTSTETETVDSHLNFLEIIQELQKVILEFEPECSICYKFVFQLSEHIRNLHRPPPPASLSANDESMVTDTSHRRTSRIRKIVNYNESVDEPATTRFTDSSHIPNTTDQDKVHPHYTLTAMDYFKCEPDEIEIETVENEDLIHNTEIHHENENDDNDRDFCADDGDSDDNYHDGAEKLKSVSTITQKPYKCDICETEFSRQDHLTRHFKIKHPGEDLHKCNVCQVGFKNYRSFALHKKTHTEEKSKNSFHAERDTCSVPMPPSNFEEENANLGLHVNLRLQSLPIPLESSESPLPTANSLSVSESDITDHRKSLRKRKSINYAEFIDGSQPTIGAIVDELDISETSVPENINCEEIDIANNNDTLYNPPNPEGEHENSNDPFSIDDSDSELEEAKAVENERNVKTVKPYKATGETRSYNCKRCYICSLEFPVDADWLAHMRATHEEQLTKPYKCDICKASFSNSADIQQHFIEIHPEALSHTCAICKKIFANEAELTVHGLSHGPKNRYNCEDCVREFQFPSHLEEHMKVHKIEKSHNCDKCEKTFYAKASLICHQETHTVGIPIHTEKDNNSVIDKYEDQSSNKEIYGCGICGNKFYTIKRLNVHLTRSHTKILHKKLNCKFCNMEFFHARTLLVHIGKEHSGDDRAFACDICNKEFATQRTLTNHLKSHEDGRTVPCTHPGCTKMFKTRMYMNRHFILHAGTKSYKCEKCGKTFATNKHLSRHKSTHTGVKPLMCEKCSKCFSNTSSLNVHMLSRHKEVDGVKYKPHVCKDCGKSFTLTSQLTTHAKIHTGEKSHLCEECGICFRLPHQLRAHLKTLAHAK